MECVSHPWTRPPRERATANQSGASVPATAKAIAVPSTTAVYDQRRTGMSRNSRNQPSALRLHGRSTGTDATILTISIVILERSWIVCSMPSSRPTLPKNGWVRGFKDKRLWYLIAATRGGINRARILRTLHDRPYNANDLAGQLDLDYKTVRHHLDVLRENDCVMTLGNEGYGTLYSLSPRLQVHFDDFLEIWRRIEGRVGEK